MKTMRVVSKKESTPVSKSLIPKPAASTGKKTKVRPAPDFSKLHKKWEQQLQTGKNYKKKPTTIVQPFDVTRPGTKFTVQPKTTVLNDIDDMEMDFEGDHKALDTILQNKGLSERKVTGRTTMEVMSMSTGKIKNKSCTNLGKRRILGELPCDPDQLTEDRVITAKKFLEFDVETDTNQEEDFENDPEALISILNDEGIITASTDDRHTFAGSVCRPSLLHQPLPARQSCMSAISRQIYSKQDTEALIQAVREKQSRQDMETVREKQGNMSDFKLAKSPFKTGGFIVKDSPFGQKVITQGRNSIYGDFHIRPLSSPAIQGPAQKIVKKELMTDPHKSVKWADVLNSYSYYSPCAVPKIKEKKTLFTTIDEIDNDTDECKENIEPGKQQETDNIEINNSSDVRFCHNRTDGRNESSFVATISSSQNSAIVCSMTHSKLLEPKTQHHHQHQNTADISPYKVQSSYNSQGNVSDCIVSAKLALGARRVPVVSKNDFDSQNCVDVTKVEKNRTDCKNIDAPFHQSGISLLPKEGGNHNGTAFNLQQLHSSYNLRGVKVSNRGDDAVDHDFVDTLKLQVSGEVCCQKKEVDQNKMAMHTDEQEEKEDSDVSSDPNSKNRSRGSGSDNETVDKFVGRVKKSRKRQSIVELNESIVESQVHMDKLQEETEKLQDVKEVQESQGSQTNMNILKQLELITKQQEQLQVLQRQLQEQLSHQKVTPVSMVTTPVSYDIRSVSSANESNNNVQQQTGSEYIVNTCTENILNNNVTPSVSEDNQTVSQPMSIFASSTAALSQTLSPSRTWSPCKDLTMTPSKRQPRIATETELDITPYVTKTVPQTDGKLKGREQIRNPTPIKPQLPSCEDLFSTLPPLWTPMAFKEASQDQLNLNLTPNLCDNDIQTCTSQVAAIDLSVKRKNDDQNPYFESVANISDDQLKETLFSSKPVFKPVSAFTRVSSPTRQDENIGSLSLRANTITSPADLSSKKKRLSMRRTVIAGTNERYQEALLDEECALYSCRLQAMAPPCFTGRTCADPVAKMLVEGDEMHFIPIREDSPVRHHIIRAGSAFSCYSPN